MVENSEGKPSLILPLAKLKSASKQIGNMTIIKSSPADGKASRGLFSIFFLLLFKRSHPCVNPKHYFTAVPFKV